MSPPRSALVLAAMALLSLLSASLFHETLSASIQASTGFIKVRIQSAEVEEGRNVCAISSWSNNTVSVQVNGQSGDACIIKVVAQNNGTVPARLSNVSVPPNIPQVKAEVVVDGPVRPNSSGTVKFRLELLQDFQGTVEARLHFVMGPP